MTRRDVHLDAMLRHLGAAYYESQHGRASSADVTRALDAVEEHNGDQPVTAGAAHPTSPACRAHGTDRDPLGHQVRWRQRVRDVMTTKEDIAGEVRDLLSKVLLTEPEAVPVRVRNGVVALGGQLTAGTDPGLVPVAVRLVWDIAGVVDVIEKVGAPVPS